MMSYDCVTIARKSPSSRNGRQICSNCTLPFIFLSNGHSGISMRRRRILPIAFRAISAESRHGFREVNAKSFRECRWDSARIRLPHYRTPHQSRGCLTVLGIAPRDHVVSLSRVEFGTDRSEEHTSELQSPMYLV